MNTSEAKPQRLLQNDTIFWWLSYVLMFGFLVFSLSLVARIEPLWLAKLLASLLALGVLFSLVALAKNRNERFKQGAIDGMMTSPKTLFGKMDELKLQERSRLEQQHQELEQAQQHYELEQAKFKLLNEIFMQVASLPYPLRDKQQLLAAMLHLVAESSLGDEAAADVAGHYSKQIEALAIKQKSLLSNQQFKFLSDLKDHEKLKELLQER